jgi:uncharacterized protein YjiS (DUF1127 family)
MLETKMTSLSPTAAQPGRQTSPGGFVRWIEGAAYALVNYLECRAAVKALCELDDRALKDIGIARCQIEAAVDGTLNPDMARLR